jgi:Berberine and berberine like
MRPFTTGAAYLNFTAEDRVREAFGADKYARLVALKDRYDAHGFGAASGDQGSPC